MKQQFIKSTSLSNDHGAVLLILAAGTFALMTVFGLGIDSGNLYRAQLRLQSAVDAATISGVALLMREPLIDGDELEERAELMVKANLIALGYELDVIKTLRATLDDTRSKLHVEAKIDKNLYLLGAVPGIGFSREVFAESEAKIEPIILGIIIDLSNSMNGSTSGKSDCTTANCAEESKLVELKVALENFLSRFDETRDMISLVSFGTGAKLRIAINPNGGFDKQAMISKVRELEPHGGTNTCDGLITSYYDVKKAMEINKDTKVAYILFTDGVPTAGRFFFNNPASSLPENNPLEENISIFDYSNYSYKEETLFQKNLPAHLLNSPLDVFDPGSTEEIKNPPPPVQHPSCSIFTGPPSNPLLTFGLCLKDLGFLTPDGKVWGASVPFNEFSKHYFHCAIAWADFLRGKVATWYVVGLGEAAPAGNDPYQDADDSFYRKDYFLYRLANDPRAIYEEQPEFPGFPDLEEITKGGGKPGAYFPAQNAADLKGLFDAIATRIRFRLTL